MRLASILFAVGLALALVHFAAGRAPPLGPITPADCRGQRVGVVGAGVAAATLSHYLRHEGWEGPIDVFERSDYVGGRLKHLQFGGRLLECGGDAWSSVNYYMQSLSKQYKVEFADGGANGNGMSGLWDGQTVAAFPKKSLLDSIKVYMEMLHFEANLLENYSIRGLHHVFHDIPAFLHTGGLDKWAATSMRDLLATSKVNPSFSAADVEPVIRVIYDQDLSVSAFAGFVSLLPAATAAFTVKQGNSHFVHVMLNATVSSLTLNTAVSRVSYNSSDRTYTFFDKSGATLWTGDVVVIAAPLEHTDIQWEGVQPQVSPRPYKHWFVTHVEAHGLSARYFNTTGDAPDDIFTTQDNADVPFNVISFRDMSSSGNKIYKIFSNGDVSTVLADIFEGVVDHHVQHWPYTFPDLAPTRAYQPLRLSDNLYYVNAMESVVTAMEGSAISSRNIAKWIAGHC
mmetsp:Transcript_35058/g.88210  ORF Transcript_35058/g.88210 Transcript_35058/m.88210 type:complete len:455 (+) Transcript_35058:117-1481(+)